MTRSQPGWSHCAFNIKVRRLERLLKEVGNLTVASAMNALNARQGKGTGFPPGRRLAWEEGLLHVDLSHSYSERWKDNLTSGEQEQASEMLAPFIARPGYLGYGSSLPVDILYPQADPESNAGPQPPMPKAKQAAADVVSLPMWSSIAEAFSAFFAGQVLAALRGAK